MGVCVWCVRVCVCVCVCVSVRVRVCMSERSMQTFNLETRKTVEKTLTRKIVVNVLFCQKLD